MNDRLRHWIVDVLEQHRPLLAIAFGNGPSSNGWLKFELALYAAKQCAQDVEVEPASASGARSDPSFVYEGKRYDVELKTCNSNWRMDGVRVRTRPITMNIDSVIIDGVKLRRCPGEAPFMISQEANVCRKSCQVKSLISAPSRYTSYPWATGGTAGRARDNIMVLQGGNDVRCHDPQRSRDHRLGGTARS